jgi:hypothetical protein
MIGKSGRSGKERNTTRKRSGKEDYDGVEGRKERNRTRKRGEKKEKQEEEYDEED